MLGGTRLMTAPNEPTDDVERSRGYLARFYDYANLIDGPEQTASPTT